MSGNTQAFIVRIWHEETGNTETTLVRRGSIEHVGSGERRFFSRLDDMLRFIEERSEPSLDRPASISNASSSTSR